MVEEVQYLASVVIVTYNGRAYLDPCLSSVLDQELPGEEYEVIVVDNNSRDGSADFIEQHYPSVRLIRLDRNYGPNQAIHRALQHVRGKYSVYLHQDTVVHRRWLVEMVDVFNNHPQVAMVESNVILPGWPEYDPQRREGLLERAYVCDVNSYGVHEFRTERVTPTSPPIPVLAAYGPSVMVNQQILADLGFFLDPDLYMHADDLEFGLRLNLSGHQVVMAPRSVVYHDMDRWRFKWDVRSVLKAFYSTRNIILVLYQICYASEFLHLLPRVMFGKALKAQEGASSTTARALYALAAIPLILLCLPAALLKMPAYRKRRDLTLSRRTMKCGWLVDRFVNRDRQTDLVVWGGARG